MFIMLIGNPSVRYLCRFRSSTVLSFSYASLISVIFRYLYICVHSFCPVVLLTTRPMASTDPSETELIEILHDLVAEENKLPRRPPTAVDLKEILAEFLPVDQQEESTEDESHVAELQRELRDWQPSVDLLANFSFEEMVRVGDHSPVMTETPYRPRIVFGDSLDCEVISVVSPSCFYVHLKILVEVMAKLVAVMQDFYNETDEPVSLPDDQLCAGFPCVYRHDSVWRRGMIRRGLDVNGNIWVQPVDFEGPTKTTLVSRTQTRAIANAFHRVPLFTVQCSAADKPSGWKETEVEVFSRLMLNQKDLVGVFTSRLAPPGNSAGDQLVYNVQLRDKEGEDLNVKFRRLLKKRQAVKVPSGLDSDQDGPPLRHSTIRVHCAICMDTADEIKATGRKVVATFCGHIFCGLCLRKHLDSALYCYCPTCRTHLPRNRVHNLYL